MTDAITNAINYHGTFFKKAVIDTINKTFKGPLEWNVLNEEFPVKYLIPTAIDIVASSRFVEPGNGLKNIYTIIECKRAYTKEKQWVFVKTSGNTVKISRRLSKTAIHNQIFASKLDCEQKQLIVCSEGLEITTKKETTANPNPIFEAANQVCSGYLGFIKNLELKHEKIKSEESYIFIPVIVTTAKLSVIENDSSEINLSTGTLEQELKLKEVPWLLYEHPYAGSIDNDFRTQYNFKEDDDEEKWGMLEKESIYVVNSERLTEFLTSETIKYVKFKYNR